MFIYLKKEKSGSFWKDQSTILKIKEKKNKIPEDEIKS